MYFPSIYFGHKKANAILVPISLKSRTYLPHDYYLGIL